MLGYLRKSQTKWIFGSRGRDIVKRNNYNTTLFCMKCGFLNMIVQ
jgi:hypothetical protein